MLPSMVAGLAVARLGTISSATMTARPIQLLFISFSPFYMFLIIEHAAALTSNTRIARVKAQTYARYNFMSV